MSSNPRSLTRRPSRSLAATVLAVVVLALGALGTWLLGHLLVTGTWPAPAATTIKAIASTTVGSAPVLVVGCVLALLGLVLLGLALWPGRPRYLEVLEDEVPGQTVVSRKDLTTLIRHQVERADGVDGASVKLRGQRVRVSVGSPLGASPQVRESAGSAVRDALEHMRPAQPIRPRVRVQRTS